MTRDNSKKIEDTVASLIKARYPLIGIQTHEESRALTMLGQVGKRTGKDLITWSLTSGMEIGGTEYLDLGDALERILVYDDESGTRPKLFVLLDVHIYLGADGGQKNDYIVRKIRDVTNALVGANSSLVMVGPIFPVPIELEKLVTLVDLPLPNRGEFEELYRSAAADLRSRQEVDESVDGIADEIESGMSELTDAVAGLTLMEAENVIARAIVDRDIRPEVVIQEKAAIIRKAGILEYHHTDVGIESVGGLDNLKDYVRRAGKRFTREAEEYGLTKPKGLLLIGLPGTGKSLTAKAIARELKMPLLRLDMADVSSKYYGETTSNLKAALNVADAVSPAILWWDEVEKMFATGGDGGHEETLRALSTLLTHMEESTAPVFRVATANNTSLKPEFMARFEKIFFLDAPHYGERMEIIAIHIKNVGRNPADYDIGQIAERTEGYVGREIRNVVMGAMEAAFDDGVEFTTEHILAECNAVVPMTEQKKEEIAALQKWADRNAVKASKPYVVPDVVAEKAVVKRRRKVQVD